MAKKAKSYNLDEEIHGYLKKKGKELDRSASWYLNHLLTQAVLAEKNEERMKIVLVFIILVSFLVCAICFHYELWIGLAFNSFSLGFSTNSLIHQLEND